MLHLLGKRSVISQGTWLLLSKGVTFPKFALVRVHLRASVPDGVGNAGG